MLSHHLLALIVSQTDQPVPLTWPDLVRNLIVVAPVVAFMGWRLSLRDKEIEKLREELAKTSDKVVAMAERALPALVEATRTLSEVRAAMEPRRQGADLDQVLRQLKRLTDDLRPEE